MEASSGQRTSYRKGQLQSHFPYLLIVYISLILLIHFFLTVLFIKPEKQPPNLNFLVV